MDIFPAYLILAVVFGLIPATIAYRKGHSFWLEWLIALVFSPILATIHSVVMKPNTRSLDRRSLANGMVRCPDCAELVKQEARVCRYCGHEFV